MEAKWVLAGKGKPTENGWYIVLTRFGDVTYMSIHNGVWNVTEDGEDTAIEDEYIKAWSKIPEFKEEEIEDGREEISI